MSLARTSNRTGLARLWRLLSLAIISVILLPGIVAFPAHAATQAGARAALAFPDGSLIRDQSTGAVYLNWAGVRHWITSPTALSALGYTSTPTTQLTHTQILTIPNGSTIGVRPVVGIGRLYPLSSITSSQVTLTLSQASVVPGQTFTFDGIGFRPGEIVKITASGYVANVIADGSGHMSTAVQSLVSAGYGLHHVVAFGTTSGTFGIQVYHAVPAAAVQLSAAPSTVQAGTSFSVSGSGFVAGEHVYVFLGTATSTQAIASAAGSFGPISVLIPASTQSGTYTLTAYGVSSARSANTQITVTSNSVAPTPTPAPVPAATLTITPASLNAGGQTVFSGAGFQPGEQILIRVNGTLQGSVTATGTGGFTGYLFSVPAGTVPGNYPVQLSGATSGRSASATLTVILSQPANASIAISPLSAMPGSRVTVAGTGFSPGEAVIISFNNQIVQNVTADGAGSFTNGSFNVATTMAPGQYGVAATGASSTRTANAVLTVSAAPVVIVARAFLNPSTVVQNATTTIAGTGFAAHETVLARVDGVLVQAAAANESGVVSIRYAARLALGAHTITLSGASSNRAAAARLYVVQPITASIGVTPGSTHRGSTVTVSGHNFAAREVVLVRFRNQIVQAVNADGSGNFANARFTVPGSAPYGASQVTATGAGSGRHASAIVKVQPTAPSGSRISVNHNKVHRGDTVTVSGKGFFGGEIVLIRFNNDLVQAVTADRHGNFSHAGFRVPVGNRYGTFTVKATGSRSGRNATAKLRVVAKVSVGISVTPTNVLRGHKIKVTGHGYQAGEIVLIYVRGRLADAQTADKHGNFKKEFTIARSSSRGVAIVMATGARSHRHAEKAIAIL